MPDMTDDQLLQLICAAPHTLEDCRIALGYDADWATGDGYPTKMGMRGEVFVFHARLSVDWAHSVRDELRERGRFRKDDAWVDVEPPTVYSSDVEALFPVLKPYLDEFARFRSNGRGKPEIAPSEVAKFLSENGIQAGVQRMIPSALIAMGWEKTGRRARIGGQANPVAVYQPGKKQIARWIEEDDLNSLI